MCHTHSLQFIQLNSLSQTLSLNGVGFTISPLSFPLPHTLPDLSPFSPSHPPRSLSFLSLTPSPLPLLYLSVQRNCLLPES